MEPSAERARDQYLAENGFSVAAYDEPWNEVSFLFLTFKLPNPPSRRRAIRFHDLHHVATGFGTDLIGEAEISAWELRRGIGTVGPYVSLLIVQLALLGLVIAPRRTIAAWRASNDSFSLFHGTKPYDELLTMSVAELRAYLGVPTEGIAKGPQKRHPKAPHYVDPDR